MTDKEPFTRVDKGLERGNPFEILVDGESVQAYQGETIAAALIATGRRCFRRTAKFSHPRGFYCGMGVCWECLMVVDGQPNVRTCITLAKPGMRVATQLGLGEKV